MRFLALCSFPLLALATSACALPGSPGSPPAAAGGPDGATSSPSSEGSSSGGFGAGPSTGEGDAGASPGAATPDGAGGPLADATEGTDAGERWSDASPASVTQALVFDDAGCAKFQYEGENLTECQGPGTPPSPGSCALQLKHAGESRCSVTASTVSCTHLGATIGGREVDWQVPLGTPPQNGWPAAVLLQPSLFPPSMDWSGDSGAAFGAFNYFLLEAMLLDNGFAVIEPTADNNGNFWDTNFPNYGSSGDATFVPVFLDAIRSGTFGPIDRARLFATGMSSGGFMTSRMAVSYPGWFRALVVQSGGYASCAGGVACGPTLPLPTDHPPTLFLHGALDVAVPLSDAQTYFQALGAQGTQTEIIVDAQIFHEALKIAPQAVACWFLQHDQVHP
jgi:hypothetical protein